MLPPVIAGVDGSAESLAAAEWAAHEAARRDLPLRLTHVWNWHPRQEDGEPVTAAQRHQARRVLRQAEERVRSAAPDVHLYDEQVESSLSGRTRKPPTSTFRRTTAPPPPGPATGMWSCASTWAIPATR
jgi:nucleotide-binding universal stress UspA family protein